MRIAFASDLPGNLASLDPDLEVMARHGVAPAVTLGDAPSGLCWHWKSHSA